MVQILEATGDSGAQELGWFRQWQQQGIQELRNWAGSDSGSSRRFRSSGMGMVQTVLASGDSVIQELGMVQSVVAAGDSGALELGWFRQW